MANQPHRQYKPDLGKPDLPKELLVIACGALAKELEWLRRHHAWQQLDIQCIDAALHNTPALIPARVNALLERYHAHYEQVFVAYADCGTSGKLDEVLNRWQVQRLPGPHCYSVFAGHERFQALAEAEPGTFYLTDFLVRHFNRLVIQGLKLEAHPQLIPQFFGHYQKVVYLAQQPSPELTEKAQAAAHWLGLPLNILTTGLEPIATAINSQLIAVQQQAPIHSSHSPLSSTTHATH